MILVPLVGERRACSGQGEHWDRSCQGTLWDHIGMEGLCLSRWAL